MGRGPGGCSRSARCSARLGCCLQGAALGREVDGLVCLLAQERRLGPPHFRGLSEYSGASVGGLGRGQAWRSGESGGLPAAGPFPVSWGQGPFWQRTEPRPL